MKGICLDIKGSQWNFHLESCTIEVGDVRFSDHF